MLPRTLLTLVLVAFLLACTGQDDPGRKPGPRPTPIDAYDAEGVALPRAPLCSLIPEGPVELAVGGEASTAHYENGQSAPITAGIRDVAHEFGCSYAGPGGVVARAWVFAPPVTPGMAADVLEGVRRTKGCRLTEGHGFGEPGTGSVCASRDLTEAAYRGLFGDTWFTCQLSRPRHVAVPQQQRLLASAGEWCVAVVESARVRG